MPSIELGKQGEDRAYKSTFIKWKTALTKDHKNEKHHCKLSQGPGKVKGLDLGGKSGACSLGPSHFS